MHEKYLASETNRQYKFPKRKGADRDTDSERSLLSLDQALFYDLKKQNDNLPIDENDRLVELLYSFRNMDKQGIRDEVE